MSEFIRDPKKTYVVHIHNMELPYEVYLGRSQRNNKWGNPYSHKEGTLAKFTVGSRKEAIQKFEEYLHESGLIKDIEELRGKVLGCWCCKTPADGSERSFVCHGQVIAKILNYTSKQKLLL